MLSYNEEKRDEVNLLTARDITAAQRVQDALKLRLAKATYEEIAEQCGYGSRASAYNAVQREMERRISSRVDEIRLEETMLLDALQGTLVPLALAGDLGAVDRMLAVMARRAKLHCLDQPSLDAVDYTAYSKTIILTHEPEDMS